MAIDDTRQIPGTDWWEMGRDSVLETEYAWAPNRDVINCLPTVIITESNDRTGSEVFLFITRRSFCREIATDGIVTTHQDLRQAIVRMIVDGRIPAILSQAEALSAMGNGGRSNELLGSLIDLIREEA